MADKKAPAKMATNPEMQGGQRQEQDLVTRREAMITMAQTTLAVLLGGIAGAMAEPAEAKIGNIQATVAKEGAGIAEKKLLLNEIDSIRNKLASGKITETERENLVTKLKACGKKLTDMCEQKLVCDATDSETISYINRMGDISMKDTGTSASGLLASNP